MPGDQRLLLCRRRAPLPIQRHGDAVQRLAAVRAAARPSTARPASRPTTACATPADAAALVAELLVRVGLIAQQHRLVRPHEADRARRRIEMGLQLESAGTRLASATAGVTVCPGCASTAADHAVGGRVHHEADAGLALGGLLRQLGPLAFDARPAAPARARAVRAARASSARDLALVRGGFGRSSACNCACRPSSSSCLVCTCAGGDEVVAAQRFQPRQRSSASVRRCCATAPRRSSWPRSRRMSARRRSSAAAWVCGQQRLLRRGCPARLRSRSRRLRCTRPGCRRRPCCVRATARTTHRRADGLALGRVALEHRRRLRRHAAGSRPGRAPARRPHAPCACIRPTHKKASTSSQHGSTVSREQASATAAGSAGCRRAKPGAGASSASGRNKPVMD